MQQMSRPRRDPAPSRIAYRLQRLWLTPTFRLALRFGLPLALVVGVIYYNVANPVRRAALISTYQEIRHSIENRPEFMVSMMSIDGASPPLADAIRSMLAIHFPISSFSLDLHAIRAKIEALDAVASADIRVSPGGVLAVRVVARKPALVWRLGDVLFLVDAGGHRVAQIRSRAARADLPLIAGAGAAEAAPQALRILAAAGPLAPRIRGLERVGERRWDVVLDRDQRIMLPQEQPVRALERVIAWDQAQGLLERGVSVVDMRLAQRPTLRLTEAAYAARQAALGMK